MRTLKLHFAADALLTFLLVTDRPRPAPTAVTGTTAASEDWSAKMKDTAPLVRFVCRALDLAY